MTERPFQPDNNQTNIVSEQYRVHPYVILLMDDEESIIEPYGKLLEMKGYIVYTAYNGEEALAACREAVSSQQRIDVAVIDLTIHDGMGGLETVAEIKLIDPDIRAIASTGHLRECLTDEYKKHGFVGILPKPYVLKELIEAIERAIRMEKNNPE
ncbi:MAG: response regulator [Methanoregulaceae archaeon]|nr:response regulator [Methanoregulaceae archaeon]